MSPSFVGRRLAAAIPDAADIKAGFKELTLETVAGQRIVVRVARPQEDVRADLLRKYILTNDVYCFIFPSLAPQFQSAKFLNSLTPLSLLQLSIAAGVLCGGPAALSALTDQCQRGLAGLPNHGGN